MWDAVRDGNDEDPPPSLLFGLSAFTFFLMMLSHTGVKLNLPPSLLRLGLRALMYMASFTPLSNHLGSVVNTSVFSNCMDGWMDERCFRPLLCTVKAELGQGQPGLMRWIWDETLPQSSINRSTFYSAAHHATKWASGRPLQLHGMLRMINVDVFWNLWGRQARSLMFAKHYLQGSFSLTNIHRIALFSFDLVHWSHHILFTHGILRFHQQLSQCACWFKICWNAIISENSPHCSENSFTYGITTEIFFDWSFTDVSIVSPGVYTSFSVSLLFFF